MIKYKSKINGNSNESSKVREKIKQEKSYVKTSGITLIALIVTIVILLILAGVTVNIIFSENGILKVAQDVGNKQEIETLREKIENIRIAYLIKKKINNNIGLDDFWNELVQADIITDKADDDQLRGPEAGENKTEIYTVITNDGYSVEIIVDKNGNITIGEIEKAADIKSKIRNIAVTNKTKTSINIRVLARKKGETVKAYWKKANEVLVDELEENIEGYTEITLNDNLEGVASPLIAGEEYKIKAILKNGEEVVSVKSINEIAELPILVNSITLNKTSLNLEIGESQTLTASVEPTDADNLSVTWESSDDTVATVSATGEVIGVKVGEATIKAIAKDNGKKSSNLCHITVESDEPKEITYSWDELAEIAKKISNEEAKNQKGEIITKEIASITSSTKATVKIGEIEKTLRVGDWKKIDGKRVRILGFNYDTLTLSTSYGGTTSTGRAGISFEYWDCLIENTQMDSSNYNAGGWKDKSLYKILNTNSNAKYKGIQTAGVPIKQVQKIYNAPLKSTDKIPKTSSDYLWLLSCSEIWGDSAKSGYVSGYSNVEEGSQYALYANLKPTKPAYNMANPNLIHYDSSGVYHKECWLRSPLCDINMSSFCSIDNQGKCYNYGVIAGIRCCPRI